MKRISLIFLMLLLVLPARAQSVLGKHPADQWLLTFFGLNNNADNLIIGLNTYASGNVKISSGLLQNGGGSGGGSTPLLPTYFNTNYTIPTLGSGTNNWFLGDTSASNLVLTVPSNWPNSFGVYNYGTNTLTITNVTAGLQFQVATVSNTIAYQQSVTFKYVSDSALFTLFGSNILVTAKRVTLAEIATNATTAAQAVYNANAAGYASTNNANTFAGLQAFGSITVTNINSSSSGGTQTTLIGSSYTVTLSNVGGSGTNVNISTGSAGSLQGGNGGNVNIGTGGGGAVGGNGGNVNIGTATNSGNGGNVNIGTSANSLSMGNVTVGNLIQQSGATNNINALTSVYAASATNLLGTIPASQVTGGAVVISSAPNNGTTDATANIQAALNTMTNGGTYQFTAGTYKLTSTITITNPNVQIVGVGRATVLMAATDYGDILNFTVPTYSAASPYGLIGNGVENLRIDSSVVRTTGWAIDTIWTSGFDVERVWLGALQTTALPAAKLFQGINVAYQDTCQIQYVISQTISTALNVTGSRHDFAAPLNAFDGWASHCEFWGQKGNGGGVANSTGTGITVSGDIGGFSMDYCQVGFFGNGMTVNISRELFLTQVFFDTDWTYGLHVNSCGRLTINNPWAAGCGSDGICIDPSAISQGMIINGAGTFYANGGYGLRVGTSQATGSRIAGAVMFQSNTSGDIYRGDTGFNVGADVYGTVTTGGGGGGTTVYTVANCVDWQKADALTYANGGAVTNWVDSTGNNDNAVTNQISGVGATPSAPTFVTSAINSKPAVNFTGGQFLNLSNALALQSFTVFAVVKYTNQPIFIGSKSANNQACAIDGSIPAHDYLSLYASGSAVDATTYSSLTKPSWSIFALSHSSSGTTTFYQNNTSLGTVSGYASTAFSLDAISGINNGGSQAGTVNGQIAEILIYSTALNSTDVGTVDAALDSKYAIY